MKKKKTCNLVKADAPADPDKICKVLCAMDQQPHPEGTRYVILIRYLYSGVNTFLSALKLPRKLAGGFLLNPPARI
jgi:hypothetical protein